MTSVVSAHVPGLVQALADDDSSLYCKLRDSVLAIDRTDGHHLWSAPATSGRGLHFIATTTAALTVLVETTEHKPALVVLSPATGHVLDTVILPDWPLHRGICLHAGRVWYIERHGGHSTRVSALDPVAGRRTSIVIPNGFETLRSVNGRLWIVGRRGAGTVGPESGLQEVWDKSRVESVFPSGASTVFWGREPRSRRPWVARFENDTGRTSLLSTPADWTSRTQPLTTGQDALFVTDACGKRAAHGLDDLAELWVSVPEGEFSIGFADIFDETLVVHERNRADDSTRLVRHDLRDGSLLDGMPVPDWKVFKTLMSNGTLYLLGFEQVEGWQPG